MSTFGKLQDPKRHRSYNSRIISAPPRRRSVVGPEFSVVENEPEERLQRTLYRLPGDARGSTESMQKSDDELPQPESSTEEVDAVALEKFNRRRASNIRMQNIIKSKILIPMSDVDRQPEISSSSKRSSFDANAKTIVAGMREVSEVSNSKGESIPMQNMGSERSDEPPLSASSRRFANLAKVKHNLIAVNYPFTLEYNLAYHSITGR